MNSWSAIALNTAPDSSNRIHGDEIAKQYGFEGGLVPGVTVAAYLVHPAVEKWGLDWLNFGFANCRVTSPLYDKESFKVDMNLTDEASCLTTLIKSNKLVSANAEISLTQELPIPPIRRNDPIVDDDYKAPKASFDLWKELQQDGCQAFRFFWGAENPLTYLSENKHLPLLLQPNEGGFSNFSFLLGCSNWSLAGNAYMNPWVHLQTISQNYRSVPQGTSIISEMEVKDFYEKKGHEFVDVNVNLFDEKDDTCIMTINLIAIFKLRGS